MRDRTATALAALALAIAVAPAARAGSSAAGTDGIVFVPPTVFPAIGLAPAAPSGAQTAGPGQPAAGATAAGQTATPAATTGIVSAIEGATFFCARLSDDAYQIDCLAERLGSVARGLPRSGDYAEARQTLERAADRLAALAARNSDLMRPRISAREQRPGGQATGRPLRAVREAAVAEVRRQAADILEEAETELLRSASASAQRRVHYQRVSAVVGSAKVLLRSA